MEYHDLGINSSRKHSKLHWPESVYRSMDGASKREILTKSYYF
jgi:hypothetical protein